MFPRSALLLTLALLLGTPPCRASEQSAGKTLTWDECVAIALKNSPDLFSSLKARDAGKASYYGSFNTVLPQFTVNNSYTDGNSFNSGSTGGSTTGSTGGSYHWEAQGIASLNVFNVGDIAGIRTASGNLSQAEANLRLTSSSVRFNLREAFAQLLFAEHDIDVTKMILNMRQRNAQMIILRYNSGRESKGNMMRSKAQVVQAQADYDQSVRNLRTAQKSLDRQLGMDDFVTVETTGSLVAQQPSKLPENLTPYLAARPDVALQEAVVQTVKAGVMDAWSTAFPNLSLSYTRSQLGTAEFPSNRYNWTALGLLTYPLFGGGPTSTYFAVSAAKRNLEKAQQDLRTVTDQAIVDLETNWSSLTGAIDQVKVQAELLAAARQRNDEADIMYASGLLDFNSWEIIASDRINQEKQAIQSQLNAVDADAAWQKSTGQGLGD